MGSRAQAILSDLTETERETRETLEAVVDSGLQNFIEVGDALTQLRDRKLYRDECPTFDEYCKKRFKIGRHYAFLLIEAAEIEADIAGENVDHGQQNGKPNRQLPNERVAREVARAPRKERKRVWKKAIAKAKSENKEKPTAAIVRRVVAESKPADAPQDEIGRTLAEPLRDAFSSRDSFDEALNLLSKLSTILNPLMGDPQQDRKPVAGGEFLSKLRNDVVIGIKNLRAHLNFARPYALCPHPHGKTICNACKNLGWLPKELYERAPKDLRGDK